jgi:hypothetical protein
MIFVTGQARKENGSPVPTHSTAGPESVSPTETIAPRWLIFLVEFIQLQMYAPELFHQLLVFLSEALVCVLQVLQLRVKALLLLLVFHFAGIVPGRLLGVEE